MTLSPLATTATWLSESIEGERVVLRIGVAGDFLIAEWPGAVRLRARENGSDVHLEVADGIDPDLLNKLNSGVVPGLLGHLTGNTTLHGSSVAIGTDAVVFLGESGSGKSTFAATFCKAAGAALLADDMARVTKRNNAFWSVPSEAHHWLVRASRDALGHTSTDARVKVPIAAGSKAETESRIRAFVFLKWGEELALRPMRSAQSMIAMSPALVRFDLRNREIMRRDFEHLGDLCTQVPIYELIRPKDFSKLNDSMNLIVRQLRDLNDT